MPDEVKLDEHGNPLPPTPPPPPEPPKPLILDGDEIPEQLRGRPAKEVVELLLNTSTELERNKAILSQQQAEIEKLRPKPTFDQMTDEERRKAKENAFVNDPVTFIDKHYDERMKPLADEYFKGQAEIQYQMLKSDKERYPDFNNFDKDIRGYLDKMPLEVRANPVAIDWAYKMSRYPVLEKMVKEGKVREGLHSETGGSTPPRAPQKRELDSEEKAVAARFGMTEDEYVKFSGKGNVDEF